MFEIGDHVKTTEDYPKKLLKNLSGKVALIGTPGTLGENKIMLHNLCVWLDIYYIKFVSKREKDELLWD